jgi:Pyridine nucleotide-disulphide oxidoreductase
MSSRQILRPSALVVGRALAAFVSSYGIASYNNYGRKEESHSKKQYIGETEHPVIRSWASVNWNDIQQSLAVAFEPSRTSLDAAVPVVEDLLLQTTTTANTTEPQASNQSVDYDFIIIGNGNAGLSALRTLRQRCPKAKIAVIDPLRPTNSTARIQYYRETVTGFDPKKRTVRVLSNPTLELRYKHGVLVATGARGAPPPLELFEQSSLSRVLELRTTELLGNTKRPMMAPERVRSTVIQIAASGGKVAILGSGWEALDLACAAEQTGKKKPTIVFSNPGPAWNILPPYLSSELRKKLMKREIDIMDRSVVRYIADTAAAKTRRLELHTARVYDLLETQRTVVDLLVVAPDSFGTKGTAALPTTEIPDRMKESSDGRPWYKTWSQLTKSSTLEPSIVACFEDDGRISVNTELAVASQIYAAGSVAKYPNSATGQASIAGEGTLNGTEAGRVAAFNMSREYRARQGAFSSYYEEAESFARYSLPVWRSDIPSYQSHGVTIVSSLSSLGVQALCVGNCDSERLQTRGFWWTNTSAQRKVNKLIEVEEEKMAGQPGDQGRISNYRTLRRQQSRKRKRMGLVQPIYGIGVVFYLDSNGCIRGIMTWGLPFTDEEGGMINPRLLAAIERAVLENAGVSALDAEENHQIMNNAMAIQSQRFVKLAIEGQDADSTALSHGLDGAIEGFSTPLYRYTEVAPTNQATVRVLKRKEGGALGVMGEDLYARDEMAMEQERTFNEREAIPSNIPVTNYPITVVPFQVEEVYGRKAASMESLEEMNRYMATQRGWEENENRARPAKEDAIWLRPGDEKRNYSRKQMLIDAYRSIMFAHRS